MSKKLKGIVSGNVFGDEYTKMMLATVAKKVDRLIRRLGIGNETRNLIFEAPIFS
jgi:hypothetical protein